jgi:hypothetical protein
MVSLRSSNPEPRMSAEGLKHALPQCNSDGRFASISGHHVGKYYLRCRRVSSVYHSSRHILSRKPFF